MGVRGGGLKSLGWQAWQHMLCIKPRAHSRPACCASGATVSADSKAGNKGGALP